MGVGSGIELRAAMVFSAGVATAVLTKTFFHSPMVMNSVVGSGGMVGPLVSLSWRALSGFGPIASQSVVNKDGAQR